MLVCGIYKRTSLPQCQVLHSMRSEQTQSSSSPSQVNASRHHYILPFLSLTSTTLNSLCITKTASLSGSYQDRICITWVLSPLVPHTIFDLREHGSFDSIKLLQSSTAAKLLKGLLERITILQNCRWNQCNINVTLRHRSCLGMISWISRNAFSS